MAKLKELKPKTLFIVKQPKREDYRKGAVGNRDFLIESKYASCYSETQWVTTGIRCKYGSNNFWIIPFTEISLFQGEKCNQFPPTPGIEKLWGEQEVEILQDEPVEFFVAQVVAYQLYEGWRHDPERFDQEIRDWVIQRPDPSGNMGLYQNPQLAEDTIVALYQIGERQDQVDEEYKNLEKQIFDGIKKTIKDTSMMLMLKEVRDKIRLAENIFWPNYYEALKRMFKRGTREVRWTRKNDIISYRIKGNANKKFRLILEFRANRDVYVIVQNRLMPNSSEPPVLCSIPKKKGLWAFETSFQYTAHNRESNSYLRCQATIIFIPASRNPES